MLAFAGITLGVALIAASPAYILSVAKEKEADVKIESSKNEATLQNKDDMTAILKSTNEKILVLKPEPEPLSSKYILAALNHLGGSIRVNHIVFLPSPDNTLTIAGTAKTRSALVAFQKNLKADTTFTDAILPVSDLTQNTNVGFSIKLSFNP